MSTTRPAVVTTLWILAITALCAGLSGCGRSERDQGFYDMAHEWAVSVVDVGLYSDRDAFMDQCAAYTVELGVTAKSDEANAMRDGCWDAWNEG